MSHNGETKPQSDFDELVIIFDRKTMQHSLAGNAFDRIANKEPGAFNLVLAMLRQAQHDVETQFRIIAGIEAQMAIKEAQEAKAQSEAIRRKLGM